VACRSTEPPSTGELVDNLKQLLGCALKKGSRKTYQRAWQVFFEFAQEYAPGQSVPLSVSDVALFVSYLSAKQLAPTTISTYLSALSYVHKLQDYPDPTKAFLIQKLLQSGKSTASLDVRLPITLPVLHKLSKALDHTNSSFYQRTMFKAMFFTAFYGFFRVGELTTKTSYLGNSVVQYSDLVFLTEGSKLVAAKLTIVIFKHNSSKRPFHIHILRQPESADFCPVAALRSFCALRGYQPGPLFCLQDGSSVYTTLFNTQLRQCINFCGLDATRYKAHSFRIGAASYAAERGFSDAQIRGLGRWKSDAYKVYLRSEVLTAI